MFTFIIAISALVVGYIVYGKFIARFFGEDPKTVRPQLIKLMMV
jgi:carbon starvation protein CstA